MAMSGLSGAGESQSHDSHGISEASEAGEASFTWGSVEGVPPTRHGQKQHSPEDCVVETYRKRLNDARQNVKIVQN